MRCRESSGRRLRTVLSSPWTAPFLCWTRCRYLTDDFMTIAPAGSSIADRLNRPPENPACGHTAELQTDAPKYHLHRGKLVPWLDPLIQLMNSRWAKSQPAAAIASASALAEGGWWTQARLFQDGLVADDICRAFGTAKGTLDHRLVTCKVREELRQEHWPEWLIQLSRRSHDDPLSTMGISRKPREPVPLPKFVQWIRAAPADGALAAGNAFTDGALRGTIPKSRREGWGHAVVRRGQRVLGKFGTCCE